MDKVADVPMRDIARGQAYPGAEMTIRFHLACQLEFVVARYCFEEDFEVAPRQQKSIL